jgi:SNF2 family DNA or RNA helicase
LAKVLKLHNYQEQAVEFITAHPRCNLWAGMGMGKTVAGLVAIDVLKLCGDLPGPALILGPKRVAQNVWTKEPKKWEQYENWTVSPVVGDIYARQRALKRPAHIHTCNYEQLPWLVEHLGSSWPFKMVIADESTRIKGFRLTQGGQRARALAEVAHSRVERWINLTGTPSPNGLEDLWGQQWFVDRGDRLGRTFTAFQRRWFRRKWSGRGVEPLGHSDEEIKAKLREVTLTLDPKDYFDLNDPIERTIEVDLPPTARKIYVELEKKLFAELESGDHIEVFNEASLSNKVRQVASGGVYTEHPKWAPVHDEKIEVLKSIVEEAGGAQILVAYEFRPELEMILKAFPKLATDISKPAGFKRFESGDAQIGAAHPASMGHGIDGMQDYCNILVNYGHTWNSEFARQILERIGPMRQLQAKTGKAVFVYNIVARGTLEPDVIARQKSKVTVEDALRAYMKRNK